MVKLQVLTIKLIENTYFRCQTKNHEKLFVAAIVGISYIMGLWLIAKACKYKFIATETISFTGADEKDFISDLIVWN